MADQRDPSGLSQVMGIWEIVSISTHFTYVGLPRQGISHINIVANKYSDEIEKVIEPFIYQAVGEFLVLPFGLADIPQPITMARSPLNTVLVSSVKGNCRLSLNLR